jgi:hypothetical protein
MSSTKTARLPADAILVGLWADRLTIETQTAVLPDTQVAFTLMLEGNPLVLDVRTGPCLVVAKTRRGLVFNVQVGLDQVSRPNQQLIALFISKGRGSANIVVK